ncbi:hypothetical protein H310_01430 [Aphanomyces invadans]|uniref:RNA-binding protein n=1 Tax=Aphanomyces invadans TaxID=157072 RepID=A0A024USN5_9STRA|nr:hypothetical protein H310_01430 [Aphanomyces invadans]ETW08950.1 hypothetical protein H310_01430 [Aphanomyces invadans]|eukprot:XP_008862755.1 hypothetical protein H310_01430 [Aphanomyces invadans]
MSRRSEGRDSSRRERREYSRSRSPSRGQRRSRSRDSSKRRRYDNDDFDRNRPTRDVEGSWRDQPRLDQDSEYHRSNHHQSTQNRGDSREGSYSGDRRDGSHSNDRRDGSYSHDRREGNYPNDRREGSYSNDRREGSYPHDRDDTSARPPQVLEIEPTSTLMIKGLPFSTTNTELMDALSSFHPTGGRIIVNKVTGESRGFAFVEFGSVEDAKYVVQFFAKQPLTFQGRVAAIGYAEPIQRSHGGGHPPRCDWLCPMCNASNFAKRMECYKCGAPKSEYAVEVPRQSPDPMAAHPSCILAVRSLPLEAQEEDLTHMFMPYPGVKGIRLVRDRITNAPRGFGFVEFASVEHATAALLAIGSEFYYANALVRLSYSNEMVAPRVLGPNAQALAHSAVEAAQWSLSNPYQNTSDLDVNALLASAAAAVPTTPQVPKKDFPLSFEEAGGSFVFVSENGLYYHSDSMFFYDPTSKVYYNSFLGTYHVIDPTTKNSFLPYQVPLPVDDAVGASDPPKKDASKHGSKKKATAISFGIKPTTAKPTPAAATPLVGTHAAVPVAVKKKHADEIAKWSQQQKASTTDTPAPQPPAQPISAPVSDGQPTICLLCRRKFNSAAQLRKHEQLSDLHKQNLAKAKQTQQSLRVRESPKEALLPRVEEPAMEAVEVARVDKPLDDQSNIGGKMLKMMGWKSGEGLGKAGSGITAPVAAVGKTSGDTSGLGGGTLAPNPGGQAASKRDKINQITRARFDGLKD